MLRHDHRRMAICYGTTIGGPLALRYGTAYVCIGGPDSMALYTAVRSRGTVCGALIWGHLVLTTGPQTVQQCLHVVWACSVGM